MTNLPDVAMTNAEKQRAFRERAVAAGRCLVCGSKRRKVMPGKTVCKKCNDAAYERVKRSRNAE